MRNETTAMTANSARKSPNRLTICAYHTRRITAPRSTSRNVIGGAAIEVGSGMVEIPTRRSGREKTDEVERRENVSHHSLNVRGPAHSPDGPGIDLARAENCARCRAPRDSLGVAGESSRPL